MFNKIIYHNLNILIIYIFLFLTDYKLYLLINYHIYYLNLILYGVLTLFHLINLIIIKFFNYFHNLIYSYDDILINIFNNFNIFFKSFLKFEI